MNLFSITAGYVGAVNPPQRLTVQVSNGSKPGPGNRRVPTYGPPFTTTGDVQPMTWKDIQMVEGLNLQGVRRSIYINGQVDGLVRAENKGGDLITDPYGRVWLVAMVLEQWDDGPNGPSWVRVAATLQDQGPPADLTQQGSGPIVPSTLTGV